MRWLFLFMLVAFLFNGFDAGRHVFGATIEKQAVKMAGMDCCPDSKKGTKAATTACHYCCAGLLALVKPVFIYSPSVPDEYGLLALSNLTAKPQDGLFRPPRIS